jgi:hypothetical protein
MAKAAMPPVPALSPWSKPALEATGLKSRRPALSCVAFWLARFAPSRRERAWPLLGRGRGLNMDRWWLGSLKPACRRASPALCL